MIIEGTITSKDYRRMMLVRVYSSFYTSTSWGGGGSMTGKVGMSVLQGDDNSCKVQELYDSNTIGTIVIRQ